MVTALASGVWRRFYEDMVLEYSMVLTVGRLADLTIVFETYSDALYKLLIKLIH